MTPPFLVLLIGFVAPLLVIRICCAPVRTGRVRHKNVMASENLLKPVFCGDRDCDGCTSRGVNPHTKGP